MAIRDRRRVKSASNSILTTQQILIEYIQTNRPSAAKLLSLISFFDRQGIPEELITLRYEEHNRTVDFEEDIKVLRNFSLPAIGVQSDVFKMHRLVQFTTRKWLEQRQELERWKGTYITIMADAFPSGVYKNQKRYQMPFPHAVLVLEYRSIDKGFVQSWVGVLNNAAQYAAEQGKYEEAEHMNRRALDGREKMLGKEHPDTLTSVFYLAYLLHHRGQCLKAKPLYERALVGYRKVFDRIIPPWKHLPQNLSPNYWRITFKLMRQPNRVQVC